MGLDPFAYPRRELFLGLGTLVAAPALGEGLERGKTLPGRLNDIGPDTRRAEALYRGVHYGTHDAVHYEIRQHLSWTGKDGGRLLEVTAEEIHDGDVLDGPNALPRSHRVTVIDLGAGQVLREGLSVAEKPVDWRFDYDRAAGTVSGHMERYGPRATFAGAAAPNTTSGDGLTHLIAALPLVPGFVRELYFIAPDGTGGVQALPVRLAVTRRQFVRLGGEAVPALRVEVTSTSPFVGATGVYLARIDPPHLVLRAEYQSTHVPRKSPFDSRGCDILAEIRMLD